MLVYDAIQILFCSKSSSNPLSTGKVCPIFTSLPNVTKNPKQHYNQPNSTCDSHHLQLIRYMMKYCFLYTDALWKNNMPMQCWIWDTYGLGMIPEGLGKVLGESSNNLCLELNYSRFVNYEGIDNIWKQVTRQTTNMA